VSTDNGVTWGAVSKVIDISTGTPGRPALVRLRSGALFLTTRYNAAVLKGGSTTSWDGGVTWTSFLLLSSQFMYASSVVLPDGRVMQVYSFENSGTDADIWDQDYQGDDPGAGRQTIWAYLMGA
jgi:hypothetical protein